ncbi:hypothetical protein IQ07DRAFT_646475 [Pyrenochaeta sp. DS3sAY3a]|nr:hypothetical protein IQ07DRAFT_646475 [Pyrenochaeta sp. DS3sAY3a]
MCIEDVLICPYCRTYASEPYLSLKANSKIDPCDTPAEHVDREDQLRRPGRAPCDACKVGNEDYFEMMGMIDERRAAQERWMIHGMIQGRDGWEEFVLHGPVEDEEKMMEELVEELRARKEARARARAKEEALAEAEEEAIAEAKDAEVTDVEAKVGVEVKMEVESNVEVEVGVEAKGKLKGKETA